MATAETVMSTTPLEEIIFGALREVIAMQATAISDQMCAEAKERIDAMVREEVAKAALTVTSFVSMHRAGPELVITIHDKRKPEAG
jgi:hypothetical protein